MKMALFVLKQFLKQCGKLAYMHCGERMSVLRSNSDE